MRVEFQGEPIEVLGWILLAIPSALLIVPLPSWFAAVCRWFARNLLFSDGARAEFHGRGAEIFGWVLLACLGLGLVWTPLPTVHVALIRIEVWPFRTATWPLAAAGMVLWVASVYAAFRIVRWCVEKTVLGAGENFRFHGTFRDLLGWQILNSLAALTIIGWAWTTAAMYRWAAGNTRSEHRALKFHGEGFEILWRSFATVLFSLPVVTIPWAMLWYTRWLVSRVTIGGYYAGDDD